MSEEPVIGGESAPEESADGEAEAMTPETDASEAELAALLRETLLAAHDDLAAEDLAGETPARGAGALRRCPRPARAGGRRGAGGARPRGRAGALRPRARDPLREDPRRARPAERLMPAVDGGEVRG